MLSGPTLIPGDYEMLSVAGEILLGIVTGSGGCLDLDKEMTDYADEMAQHFVVKNQEKIIDELLKIWEKTKADFEKST